MRSWLRWLVLRWRPLGTREPEAQARDAEPDGAAAVLEVGPRRSLPTNEPAVDVEATVTAFAAEGERLFQLERYEPALAAFTQSLRASQPLSVPGNSRYELYRAAILNNIGMSMNKLRRFDSARRIFEDAAAICERRWAADGDEIAAMYAGILDSLAAVQGELGYLKDAMQVTSRLVPLARRLARHGSPAETAALARALRKFAVIRAPSGSELNEALSAATEACTIFRELARVSVGAFEQEVQLAHAVLVGVLEKLGRDQEAASIRETMNIVGVPWQPRDSR